MESDTRNIMEKSYSTVRREERAQKTAKEWQARQEAYKAEIERAKAEKRKMERMR